MNLKIITDHKYRNTLYGYELTEKEKREFDYLEPEELETRDFIRYRGWVYDLGEFMQTPKDSPLSEWDGYSSDSFFSGIVIKYSPDREQIKIGTYLG